MTWLGWQRVTKYYNINSERVKQKIRLFTWKSSRKLSKVLLFLNLNKQFNALNDDSNWYLKHKKNDRRTIFRYDIIIGAAYRTKEPDSSNEFIVSNCFR